MDLNSEVQAIRREYEDIKLRAGLAQELIQIRKEISAISNEAKGIKLEAPKPAVQQAPVQSAPAPVKAAEPAKVEPAKPAVQQAPAQQAAPAPVKAAEPAKVEPVKPAVQQAPVQQPAPVKVEVKAVPAKVEPAKPAVQQAPAQQAAPKVEVKAASPSPKPVVNNNNNNNNNRAAPSPQGGARAGLVSDPAIFSAYDEVRSNDATNWLALSYEGNTKVKLAGKGSGGVPELLSHFKENECVYAYLKVISGDAESKRSKFVFITWIGERTPVMRKANVSVHKAEIKNVISQFAVEISASDLEDVNESVILQRVVKAGGANYMGQAQ